MTFLKVYFEVEPNPDRYVYVIGGSCANNNLLAATRSWRRQGSKVAISSCSRTNIPHRHLLFVPGTTS
jgi:hypothetical protein